jgi:hypothetical protein
MTKDYKEMRDLAEKVQAVCKETGEQNIAFFSSLTILALLDDIEAMAPNAARYQFLRDDEYWQQNDRYWEAIRAGGEDLDKELDGGIQSAKAREMGDPF